MPHIAELESMRPTQRPAPPARHSSASLEKGLSDIMNAAARLGAKMQTFAEYMAESFNSNASLAWDYPRHSHATATFGVDGIKVIVSFEQRDVTGPWHVVFEVDRSDSTAAVHSSFEIFNGVFQAVEEFIEVREPETIVFATKRDKLAGIYQTYLRKESSKLDKLGYRLEGPYRVDPYMELILKRVKPSGWKA